MLLGFIDGWRRCANLHYYMCPNVTETETESKLHAVHQRWSDSVNGDSVPQCLRESVPGMSSHHVIQSPVARSLHPHLSDGGPRQHLGILRLLPESPP